jgi:hypothetical protein
VDIKDKMWCTLDPRVGVLLTTRFDPNCLGSLSFETTAAIADLREVEKYLI